MVSKIIYLYEMNKSKTYIIYIYFLNILGSKSIYKHYNSVNTFIKWRINAPTKKNSFLDLNEFYKLIIA